MKNQPQNPENSHPCIGYLKTLAINLQTTNEPATCDFQQCGILTSVDSAEPVQPPFKLRNFK